MVYIPLEEIADEAVRSRIVAVVDRLNEKESELRNREEQLQRAEQQLMVFGLGLVAGSRHDDIGGDGGDAAAAAAGAGEVSVKEEKPDADFPPLPHATQESSSRKKAKVVKPVMKRQESTLGRRMKAKKVLGPRSAYSFYLREVLPTLHREAKSQGCEDKAWPFRTAGAHWRELKDKSKWVDMATEDAAMRQASQPGGKNTARRPASSGGKSSVNDETAKEIRDEQ